MRKELQTELELYIRVIARQVTIELFNELFSKYGINRPHFDARIINNPPKATKIELLKPESILKKLHQILRTHFLIKCEYIYFKNHFSGDDPPAGPIQWFGNLNQLVILFTRLFEEEFFQEPEFQHQELARHFTNKFGKALNPKSLCELKQKGVQKKENSEIVDSVINELIK